ncbi:hypothetical protein L210DRAFT_3577782, partial [Boletus edulis BED1]
MTDLNEALVFNEGTVSLHPSRILFPPGALSLAADCLYSGFMQLDMLSDIDKTASLERNALQLRPQEHPIEAFCWATSRASSMHVTFMQLGGNNV